MSSHYIFDQRGDIDAFLILSPVNRYYFTSFKSSFGMLLITREKSYFATDSRYEIAAKEKLSEKYEIIIGNYSQCVSELVLKAGKHCVNTLGVEDNYLTVQEYDKIKTQFRAFDIVGCGNTISKLRMCKTAYEIEQIIKSQKIASDAFVKILPEIKVGVSEQDIAIELEYILKKLGGEGTSFDTIVASGINTARPHAVPTNKKIAAGDIVLLDYGTKYNGYCSDITRTVCVGKGNEKFKHLYDIVLKAGNYAIDNIKVGMTAKEADSYAREFIIANGFGSNFGHGLGHGVGLEVHEGPSVSSQSEDILVENMVISIEPGIYIPDVGGIRVEDLVVIKSDGVLNITTADKGIIIL